MTQEELELIARAKHDPEAFGQLYRRYVKRIYNYHYHHTGNVADAEDLTSRTFYRALRHIGRYQPRGEGTFQAWLFRIAHNLVVNWYRDHQPQRHIALESVEPLSSPLPAPYDRIIRAEEYARLRRALESLPEDRKTLIILKFVERMTNAEIAAVMGKTEGAIKALYHRTLISLRKAMAEEGESHVQT